MSCKRNHTIFSLSYLASFLYMMFLRFTILSHISVALFGCCVVFHCVGCLFSSRGVVDRFWLESHKLSCDSHSGQVFVLYGCMFSFLLKKVPRNRIVRSHLSKKLSNLFTKGTVLFHTPAATSQSPAAPHPCLCAVSGLV